MKESNFIEAMQIISSSHSVEIIVNKPYDNGQVGELPRFQLDIRSCPGAVIHKLVENGFSVSMHNGLLSVEDYKK